MTTAALEWKAGLHNGLRSDRVIEQYSATYGRLRLWIESHSHDENFRPTATPRWVFWLHLLDHPEDVYVNDMAFTTREQAEEACARFTALLL